MQVFQVTRLKDPSFLAWVIVAKDDDAATLNASVASHEVACCDGEMRVKVLPLTPTEDHQQVRFMGGIACDEDMPELRV